MKESFDNEGVYVNGALSGARTGTSKFTAYVSPYMVVSQGGNYTKHVYMGSQRITSKVSNSGIFNQNNNPVNTTDLQDKLTAQTTLIKERFDSLGVKYSGVQQTGGLVSASPATTADKYFYHPDHLGSSSLITNGSGDLVQHIQYVPFGEVFVEERNASWSTPYKFNGKEQDEETGLCYYGARYYDPRTSVWLSVDPLAEKFAGRSSYEYCFSNPVKIVDPTGMGGELTVDETNKTITITSTFYFYGEKSSSELANSLAKSIEKNWNAANGTYTDSETGSEYKVNFNITGKHVSKFEASVKAFFNGDNPQNNFIKISDMGDDPSFIDSKYTNTGEWNSRQLTGDDHYTTGSHEYGHTLGIVNKGGDGKGHWFDTKNIVLKFIASIMYPRGTKAMSKLSYESQPTLDPAKRVVTQIAIDQIFIDNPNAFPEAKTKGSGKLGNTLNKIH